MILRIPAPTARKVEIRIAALTDRGRFGERWRYETLFRGADDVWASDLATLGLTDGDYEYEFVIDDNRAAPVPDPFAKEITRFGGYRGLLQVRAGRISSAAPFDWSEELQAGTLLPDNNRIVIYEMPLRWMAGDQARQVGLGTFERATFEHLDRLASMGINCIELLPPFDSKDTINWGYGTRFFFAPDYDMGASVDLKWFVKSCHRRGIRVLVDLVMNHARACPLADVARERYFLRTPDDEPGRGDAYGGDMFRYRQQVDGRHWARQLHFDVARYLIDEYHVDGFRIDEFRGIDNWEFVQEFRDAAWDAFRARFPDRPFIVIAEDSWSRSAIVRPDAGNPNRRKVVDAMWNFSGRDELRRLLLNDVRPRAGQPGRRERISAVISSDRRWDEFIGRFEAGFDDMAQPVAYLTSHDVEKDGERRLMNHVLSSLLRYFGHGQGSFQQVREISDAMRRPDTVSPDIRPLYQQALDRVRSGYALLMTSVAIPMLLAGEEFADIHDTNHHDWQLKMSDPVDWYRGEQAGHKETAAAVTDLIWLRHGHPALHRNEVEFFHFHPTIDHDDGRRVFAYCRTGGRPLGAGGQIVVTANLAADDYPRYVLPWPWRGALTERGARSGAAPLHAPGDGSATLSLQPFEVRVFETY
jgi:1,4-alpha-glucan branching enzyme